MNFANLWDLAISLNLTNLAIFCALFLPFQSLLLFHGFTSVISFPQKVPVSATFPVNWRVNPNELTSKACSLAVRQLSPQGPIWSTHGPQQTAGKVCHSTSIHHFISRPLPRKTVFQNEIFRAVETVQPEDCLPLEHEEPSYKPHTREADSNITRACWLASRAETGELQVQWGTLP